MNNYAAILADIKSKLESVSNIGKVYDYDRRATTDDEFIKLFAYTPAGGYQQIRGWELTRTAAVEHKKGAFWRHHQFKVMGYMGLKDADATEKTFQSLVEEICNKFRTAESPSEATWQYRNGDNPDESTVQVKSIQLRMFGNILCHCVEIALSVTERIVA